MVGKVRFVSAGAGSGKTYRLTQILHEQLTSGAVRPSGVIATTFTKKAATELRERVRSHLLGQGDYRMANAMGQARIGTINGVCGGLLERFAFEAGLATQQQVLEEGQTKALIRHSIDAVLDGPAISDFLRVVRRLGLEEENAWQDQLKGLIDQARTNDIAPDLLRGFAQDNATDLLSHFPKPAMGDLSADLLAAIDAAQPAIAAQSEAGGKKNTAEYLAMMRSMERALRGNYATWSNWAKLSKLWPEVTLKGLAEPINEVAARFAEHPLLQQDIRDYLSQMFSLCADALAIYADRKRELGVLDFADQEHLLLKVLDDDNVAGVLREELDLLMVDEFQDTSPIQLALFIKLAQFAKSVYWVGDIKQAIYGFRGSDTALMEAILQALPSMGGEKEILSASWRSRHALVTLVNAAFRSAFKDTLAPEEVDLKAQRSDAEEGLSEPAYMNWLLGGKNLTQEKSALAAGVLDLVKSGYPIFDKGENRVRPVRFGDIAILSRTGDGVADIASALRMRGIPSATAQPGLLRTPEAVLAIACLRRLNDPSDTVATAEIISLTDGGDPEMWVADRLEFLAAGGESDRWKEGNGQEVLGHALVTLLASMRAKLPLLAPVEALRSVITECDLAAIALRWKQDDGVARVRLANLEALLALAEHYDDICRSAQHAASISGLIIWLGEISADGLDNLAEPAIDAVKVMTHHGAKGLEWPVVVLTDLAANVKDRLWSITALSRQGIDVNVPLSDRFIRFWPWPFGKQGRVGVADEIALTNTAKAFRVMAIEENKRLLYVSMTRGRDLVILARSQRKPSGEWLDAIEAPWLLPAEGSEEITLPDGTVVPTKTWRLDPPAEIPEVETGHQKGLYWFESSDIQSPRLPLICNPSAVDTANAVLQEKIRIGSRIPISSVADMSVLGTAIHACIALAFADRKRGIAHEEIERILAGHGVSEQISASGVLAQVQALDAWISERWGEVEAFAEYPVQAVLPNGQVLQGRIDLLLKTNSGWVLIDHKSSPLGAEHWEEIAMEYASQLALYAQGVGLASGNEVGENWIFLPVSGGAVRLAFPPA